MSKVTDLSGGVASNPPRTATNVIYKQSDYASTVLALEGQSSVEVDYRFSGRNFTRRDRTINPRRSE